MTDDQQRSGGELLAQPLSTVGITLFGDSWKRPMAEVLEVPEAQINAWEDNPATIPSDIEAKLTDVGEGRLGEIQLILYLLAEAGLERQRKHDA